MPSTSDDPTMAVTDFTELSLLLPSWQLYALDDLAHSHGLNVGQLLRRLIGNLLQEIVEQPA